MKKCLIFLIIVMLGSLFFYGEEIPKPTYDNSLIFSWTYHFLSSDAAEIENIKSQFGNGIYAPLCFSNFVGVEMEWNINPADAGSSIQAFKNRLNQMISFAKMHNVGIHLTLTYGIARNVKFYKTAKQEDIRNCQWYNDNNISTYEQQSTALVSPGALSLDHTGEISGDKPFASESAVNDYVFTTFSRYARKLRAHLEPKVSAAFAYLSQQQAANPDVLIIISSPGESELNYNRIQNSQFMQDFFCDYSPFAVLEFRDWIKHEGLYADGEKYAGEGCSEGGSRYQGASGLANFNADFGTSFTSWNLKYYNWSLSDPVDTDYTDAVNPDSNIIPVSQYTYGGMMPTSGSKYVSGGFDPPRVMKAAGTDAFYDLWHTYREFLVAHYVKDMSTIARSSGFPKKQVYTHQIPADYLFGSQPSDPYLNPRYYSSASPLWTADAFEDIGLGVTLYDINFGSWMARTTLYGIGAASNLSDNWAALEYNPEVIPDNVSATLSSVQVLYDEMIRLYNGNPHVISFFVWKGSSQVYDFKGNNRGTAAKQFFDVIKNKARQSISTVFTPKKVESFKGSYIDITGLVNLSWSAKIWPDLNHYWTSWGNFKEFVIYRGYSEDFTTNASSEIARQTTNSYVDSGFSYGKKVYYKIAALNTKNEAGPIQTVMVDVPTFVPKPVLSVSRTRMNFGYIMGLTNPPDQALRVTNTGSGALNWTAVDDAAWLSFTPSSAVGDAVVTISADPTGLSEGTYSAVLTVSSPTAADSPQTVEIYLTVKNSANNELPFGSFDTPVDGSTVMSSIPVTGWVLDDVGVDWVKLYRDPVSGEGQTLVYIGDALFVEGARSDIEGLYPDYPCNYKAGWGYMMLTNFLPNGGNGTFKLYAVAADTFGNEVTLGTKTITCDNANAVKPFGAIDTPAQGGIASGSNFSNVGWVLTPMPNAIPTNGSTINVYIDGVNLGHPRYNIYRSDVATLFPGYANSSGSAGVYTVDMTQYRDGIHTILWTASDLGGNSDGIGSRYFTVQNASSGSASGTAAPSTKSQKKISVPFQGELSRIPWNYLTPLKVKTGYNEDTPLQAMPPGGNGFITVTLRELEPLEIHFPGETSNASALPIGSTLDTQAGVFYWTPGAGFLGNYSFDFVIKKGTIGKLSRQQVRIRIIPRYNK